MVWGNKPTDDGNFFLTYEQAKELKFKAKAVEKFIRPYYGSAEYIRGILRYCIWVNNADSDEAKSIPSLSERFNKIREFRASSKAKETRPAAEFPHRFRQIQGVAKRTSLIIPSVSSERRPYLPVGLLPMGSIVANSSFAIYDAPIWNMAIIASRLHLVWIGTVCGKLKTDYRYSNTLGWNSFPLPKLTEKNRDDLSRCAEEILLAREAHFPATIAELYELDKMPENLRVVHKRNDEVLERIYIGRCFKNDTERLDKLFEMYTKMTCQRLSKSTDGW